VHNANVTKHKVSPPPPTASTKLDLPGVELNAVGLRRAPFQPTAAQLQAIRRVPHFADGAYRDLPIGETIEFYAKRYVDQLEKFRTIDSSTVIADIGTGYGWLAMALAVHTPARIIAAEMDCGRLAAGQQIAEILGIADRIQWVPEGLGAMSLPDCSVDVVYCVEVLEHVYGDPKPVQDLARLSRDLLIVTTPNKWFPVIAHDTRLLFCHWLPVPWRKRYAAVFNRQDSENDNLFWSPTGLARLLAGFKPVSGFLHYASLGDYEATYPFHLPYVGGGYQTRVGAAKLAFYRLAAKFGSGSRYLLPNLASVWKRQF
jgi:Methyltransferase domain